MEIKISPLFLHWWIATLFPGWVVPTNLSMTYQPNFLIFWPKGSSHRVSPVKKDKKEKYTKITSHLIVDNLYQT